MIKVTPIAAYKTYSCNIDKNASVLVTVSFCCPSKSDDLRYDAREPTHLDPCPNKISGMDHAAWSIDLSVATPTQMNTNQISIF